MLMQWAILCLSALQAGAQLLPTPVVLTSESYMRHVRFLSDDALKGRGNGTAELDRAAQYIAEQFRVQGLEPAGTSGSYFQPFDLAIGSRLGSENRLMLSIFEQTYSATLLQDYVPFAIGDDLRLEGEVVFAGYGITNEDLDYDDYRDLDVTGKVVLVLAGEPPFPARDEDPMLQGQAVTKAIHAKFRHARAILIVETELPRQPEEVSDLGIGGLWITPDTAARILRSHKKDLKTLRKNIDQSLAPRSFNLPGVRATLELDVVRVIQEVRNVVGLLPATGSSAGDETVIIGAHYDHLGDGRRFSMAEHRIGEVHNGADDNASGTAGLIELAGRLARVPARQRSVLFMAFAGEELGLRGSAFWTDHPTRPLEETVAMLNMDMIGRSRNGQVLVGGVGTSPLFGELVPRAAGEAGLEIRTSVSGYGSSDHSSFYAKNIPVLFFFSGLHADYHRPTDDWQKINAEGATRILDLVSRVCLELIGLPTRPVFTKIEEPSHPSHSPAGPLRGRSGYGAYFGSVPDMTDDVRGVRFTDIRPGSPAAKSGLRGGDILVRFAGNEIRNLQDFTYMLRSHRAGETVEVTVVREGQPLTVPVTLGIRP